MLGGIGFQEIIIIVIVGLLVFGAARLPKIAKSLGQGIKEFKKSIKDTDEDEENSIKYVDQGQYSQPQQFGQYQGPAPGYGPNQQPGQYSPQGQGYAQNQPTGGESAPGQGRGYDSAQQSPQGYGPNQQQNQQGQGYTQNRTVGGESASGQEQGKKQAKPKKNKKS
ncbi:MAG: twin-arginine translocase TatA/TatE family subunit [Spirochaetota bacterium]|nr:MAG: twin-arginine translocase TatA/TatE family subunit [Spirochaetota bacterium]